MGKWMTACVQVEISIRSKRHRLHSGALARRINRSLPGLLQNWV